MRVFRFPPANYTLGTSRRSLLTSPPRKAEVSAGTSRLFSAAAHSAALRAGPLSRSRTSLQQQMDGLEAEPGRGACRRELPFER